MRIVEAHRDHALFVGANMREEDIREIAIVSTLMPRVEIVRCFNRSSLCWTAVIDDEPAALFGVAKGAEDANIGIPWLLGTDKTRTVRKAWLQESRRYLEEMRKLHPKLVNYVDVNNGQSVRWLRWLGFYLEPGYHGINKEPLYKFSIG